MFVVSDAQLAQLVAPLTPMYSSPSEWLDLTEGELTTFGEMYRSQSAVRSVVDFIAGHCARMPIKLFQRTEQKTPAGQSNFVNREYMRDHPLQKLLSVPSGYRAGAEARSNFWRNCWLDLLIYDRMCMVKIRNPDTNSPHALVRIPGVWYTPFGTDYWKPQFIRIVGNRSLHDIPIEDCVYMRGYDPIDPRVGVSPMQTLRTILQEELESNAWRRRFWANGAQPSMVITRPVDAGDWDDPSRDRFIEALRSAASRGKPLMLEEGMTVNDHSTFDPATAQFVQSKQFTREEVAHAYCMPYQLIDAQGAESANIGQYRSMLYSEVLAPILTRFVDELEDQLLTEWSADPYDEGLYLQAMIEEKMRGNFLEQVAQLQSAVGAPFILRDEARGILDLPSLSDQGADELIIPLNVSVGGEPAAARVTETIPGKPGQASPQDATPDNLANQHGPAKPPTEFEQPPTNKRGSKGDVEEPTYDSKARFSPRVQAVLAKARKQYADQATRIVQKFARRQQSATGASGSLDRKRWDKELSDDLYRMAVVTATYFGTSTAELLGGKYDEGRTYNYLRKGADIASRNINDTTETQLKQEGSIIADVFAQLHDARAPQVGVERTTNASSFGVEEAARQNGQAMKTWVVTNDNPRPSHADVDGETVKIGEPFSNGMMYPGDPAGGPDETANCDCTLEVGA